MSYLGVKPHHLLVQVKDHIGLHLLQQIRDEAHRFAITGHRKKQQQRMQTSQLEDIAGIGASKRKALIAFFGSATAVANAGIEQLQQVDGVGGELANSIYKHFHR